VFKVYSQRKELPEEIREAVLFGAIRISSTLTKPPTRSTQAKKIPGT
jgi:hypothetical protein